MLRFKNKKTKPNARRASAPGRSPIFSYYNNRPTGVSSTKQTNQKRLFNRPQPKGSLKHHLRHIPTYFAIVLIAASLLYSLVLDNQPKVLLGRSVTSNSLLRSQAVYQAGIAKLLSHSIFNRTKLTINTVSIEKQIRQMFPEIQNATVSLPIIGHRPIIGLDPADPTLVIKTQSGSFIIDNTGRALIKIDNVAKPAQPNLPVIQDNSGLTIGQGDIALPKEDVAFITTVIEQLSAKNIKIQIMQLPAIANELRVTIAGYNYYIKFNLSGDARLQSGTFLAVKDDLKSKHITPTEYIDVRVNERAFYK
ncbi:MAG TPA: hypothetical protein VLE69_01220 [Candidatus Saccharimonadales bacterium]|nr:hypothetical protein [Candidatus Saccharimonadales bacterium]